MTHSFYGLLESISQWHCQLQSRQYIRYNGCLDPWGVLHKFISFATTGPEYPGMS